MKKQQSPNHLFKRKRINKIPRPENDQYDVRVEAEYELEEFFTATGMNETLRLEGLK